MVREGNGPAGEVDIFHDSVTDAVREISTHSGLAPPTTVCTC